MNMNRGNIFSLLVLLPAIIGSIVVINLKAEASAPSPARSASQLYSRYCVSCHGRDGTSQTKKGRFSHARNLTDAEWQDDVGDERLFNSIMNGRNVRGNMPAFSNKLNDQEAESLVSFVRHFRK
ncbi:MAG TPA: cytochrome c [Pyrinomonadaceae bacterium]|nr:cytochrome c [Pyrinomonadaceae bacterium]